MKNKNKKKKNQHIEEETDSLNEDMSSHNSYKDNKLKNKLNSKHNTELYNNSNYNSKNTNNNFSIANNLNNSNLHPVEGNDVFKSNFNYLESNINSSNNYYTGHIYNKKIKAFKNLIIDNQVNLELNSIKKQNDVLADYHKLITILIPNIRIVNMQYSEDKSYVDFTFKVTFNNDYEFRFTYNREAKLNESKVLYTPIEIPFNPGLDEKLYKPFEFLINDMYIIICKFSKF